MKMKTSDGGWSPYLAGALLGLLAIASVYATTEMLGKTNYLGASTTFVRAAGFLEKMVAAEHVEANEYFTKEKVRVDWQFMLHSPNARSGSGCRYQPRSCHCRKKRSKR